MIVGPAVIGDRMSDPHRRLHPRERGARSEGSLVGAHSEVKGAILLPGAKAPHQAYVGDSILGPRRQPGCRDDLSNVKNIGREVSFRRQGEVIHTGLRKFGAVLGDRLQDRVQHRAQPRGPDGARLRHLPERDARSGYYAARDAGQGAAAAKDDRDGETEKRMTCE